MAQAIKTGYHEIFERNEFANNLQKDQLKGLVVEITGLDSDDRVVQLICQTFEALKALADFDAAPVAPEPQRQQEHDEQPVADDRGHQPQDLALNLAYTINLVLPKSDDPAVFNAIFKAVRDNLLRR